MGLKRARMTLDFLAFSNVPQILMGIPSKVAGHTSFNAMGHHWGELVMVFVVVTIFYGPPPLLDGVSIKTIKC